MKLNNHIKLFDNNIPIPVESYINNYIEKIHKQLFKNAITKYCNKMKVNEIDYKIIDIKNEDNYLLPSKAILLHKSSLKKEKIDLTDYWNLNYIDSLQKDVFNELLIDEENRKNIEIEYIDYVNGKVQFRNKFTNKTFFIDFSKINNNIQYKKQLENTFTKLYRDVREL